ncbi:MAG: hypothetical protein DRP64_08975 [Verrucomicrobia bacterium]|nr:MAG: hypothetical protein DRP64_08975 [Verrucomicrobiota bacterium]
MKILNTVVSCVAVASIVVLAGCQTPSQAKEAKAESDAAVAQAQAETTAVQEQLDAAKAEDANRDRAAKAIPGSTLTQDGTLLFTAEGQSVAKAEDGAMGLTKARIAAETIAKANLLEIIKGGLISSTVTVGDMMFQSQTVSTKVNGWLGGALLKTETSSEKESNLPDAEPVDQIVTAQASLEVSLSAWEDLQDYVE